jgi:hypothetical protein
MYSRPPPVAPHYNQQQPPTAPVQAVAVAMPIAEPIERPLGNTYRGGYAEVRILRAESNAQGRGNVGGAGIGGGGGGKR